MVLCVTSSGNNSILSRFQTSSVKNSFYSTPIEQGKGLATKFKFLLRNSLIKQNLRQGSQSLRDQKNGGQTRSWGRLMSKLGHSADRQVADVHGLRNF